MSKMNRVDTDDEGLEFDDVDLLTLYKGVPFTGEIVESDGKGNVVHLSSYRDGLQEGPECSWYPNGRLKLEGEMKEGLPRGVWRRWDLNGRMTRESEFDDSGRRIRFWERSEEEG